MTDSYTEQTKISYGKNIMNSLSGVLFGVVLFLASFVLLWWNEGNNVSQINKSNYMGKAAIEIQADAIDKANNNKLVQVSGEATTDETLTDDVISVPKTFALARKVEMYQWEEKVKTERKDNLGGSTTETKTYSYDRVWSEREINSDHFYRKSYKNPQFTIKSEKVYAKTGALGDFKLTDYQTRKMGDFVEYKDLPQNSNYRIYENSYYKGYNPENPQIGDVRITYKVVPSGSEISIIGQQKSNGTIDKMPYKDSSVYLQQDGIKTKAEMIGTFKKNNKIMTNFLRVLGWFLMFSGLNMVINPLVVIFKVVPFVEKIVGFLGKGVIMLISLALSLLTISLAWFAYRPMLSIGLLIVIGGIVFAIKKFVIDKKPQVVAAETAETVEAKTETPEEV